MQKLKKILTVLALLAVLLPVFLSIGIKAQSVTQGYGSDQTLQRGMIVALKKDDLRKVEAVNSDQFDRVLGVVVSQNDSSVYVNRDNEKIYVATTGRYSILVSNQNGKIAKSDYIAVSSVSGIGMKATSSNPTVVGTAMEDFSGSNNQLMGTATVKDSSGKENQLRLGYVLVNINIGRNPLLKTDNTLPGILRKASEMIAGKPVSSTRVYISLAVLVICTIISGSLIYSAVRSSMIAIGRNPLSKRSIVRGLFQVVLICLMVFSVGLFGVYLLLRL